jgi:hypothetical protein
MTRGITEQDWEQIDNYLFAHEVFPAPKYIRAINQVGLRDAIDLVHSRFEKLAAEMPEKFQCDLETYWSGFYS